MPGSVTLAARKSYSSRVSLSDAGANGAAQQTYGVSCAVERAADDRHEVVIARDSGLIPPGTRVPVPHISGPREQFFLPQDVHDGHNGRIHGRFAVADRKS